MKGYRTLNHVNHVNVLDNPVRFRIYEYITNRPGSYISEIAEEVSLNRGTVKYHIKILEDYKKIDFYTDNGKIRVFEGSFNYNKDEMKVISALRSKLSTKIMLGILFHKCKTKTDLTHELRVCRATISWHVRNLKKMGILSETCYGRETIYRINYPYSILIYELIPKLKIDYLNLKF